MDAPKPDEEEDTLALLLRERGYHTEPVTAYDDLDTFLASKGVPRDILGLLAQDYVRLVRERLAAGDRALGGTCRLAAKLMRQAAGWGSLARVLDTDDLLWRDLFARDFARFGERAHDWTARRPMPWKSAYLWTVFLRRRCLRALARELPGDVHAIPFGEPGSVCVLEDWSTHEYYAVGRKSRRHLEAYNVADPRFASHTFAAHFFNGRSAYDEDNRHGALPPVVSFPCDVLTENLDLVIQNKYRADMNRPPPTMRAVFASEVVTQEGTLAQHVGWNIADALYAYCSLGRHRTNRVPGPVGEEEQAIFDSLPDYPTIQGRIFLGTRVEASGQ